jgi:hypothetical protein
MNRPLPDYLNTDLEACRRLTRVLAQMDAKLFCAWNARAERYEVWGPSQSLGFAFLTAVENPANGQPCHPDLYPTFILADLRARERPFNAQAKLEENAKAVEREWDTVMSEAKDRAEYVARAVREEVTGALRHGADDVFLGLRAAEGNGPRRTPQERGQVIYIP